MLNNSALLKYVLQNNKLLKSGALFKHEINLAFIININLHKSTCLYEPGMKSRILDQIYCIV